MATLSYDEAAHLLRRMGFGGSPDEIDALAARGREGAVDYLINFNQIDNSAMETLLTQSFDFSNPDDNQKFNQGEIRRWWVTRMVTSKRQFEEKMALFWHNHFATSITKVGQQNGLYMYVQNLLFRQYGLDRFDTLLEKVSKDAAMLIWLDGITNVLGRPNENFARELQELFTMGIFDVVTGEQNYTEQDVKEIARAFTGWSFTRSQSNPYNIQFVVRQNQHDNTSKTIYPGTPYQATGNLDGVDVIAVICNRRATARYITKKLLNFFVYPTSDTSSADKRTIDKFADVYMSGNHSIKELVRAIFTSDEFFSERAFFSLVKQPIEYVVGAIRMLGGTYNPGSTVTGERRATNNTPYVAARNEGQDLFNPPDVAGWDFNLGWVNTASMLERYNFANAFLTNRNTTNPGVFVTNDQLKSYTKKTAKKTVKKFLSVLGPLSVGGEAVKALRTYLMTGDNGQPVDFVNDDATVDKKIRGLVHQIMCLPEFQLN
ncbi:MAG TPA: DUF1800 domain-containing protein [Blastocatellia bacterium]|nr:DUF1800 domain-containing protein [Blastocatellia bacterium]